MRHVQSSPVALHGEYQKHREKSSEGYYREVRGRPLDEGLAAAGRFLYLAKNAFSGKIRFNSSNRFNCSMRKGTRCSDLDLKRLERISETIRDLMITNESYEHYGGVSGAFLYLDPPYMDNPHGHYNDVPKTGEYLKFVSGAEKDNMVMISDQSDLPLSDRFDVYRVHLQRSLQYVTQKDSREIIAINYRPSGSGKLG